MVLFGIVDIRAQLRADRETFMALHINDEGKLPRVLHDARRILYNKIKLSIFAKDSIKHHIIGGAGLGINS